nr:elongation factor P hydroxylase [Lacimicrobium alkaliphilum]
MRLFDGQFAASHNTRLLKGDDEPVYLPADERVSYHRIVFAHGFYASALHEIAHWCIAGRDRRLLEDYGYWYCPDGRTAEQQAAFERAEVKPQAIEWAFCVASAKGFRVSTDNLNGVEPDRVAFGNKVRAQVLVYLERGFPKRAGQFITALQGLYDTPALSPANFISEVSNDV